MTSMEEFVGRQNITHFTTLLITETDTTKRELLQKLLADEMVSKPATATLKPHLATN